MNDDEQQQEQAGHDHRRGGDALAAGMARVLLLLVAGRPRRAVVQVIRDRLVDVQQEYEQQSDFDRDDERVGDERVRVLVEEILPAEDERVAHQVQDHVDEHREAGDADQDSRHSHIVA